MDRDTHNRLKKILHDLDNVNYIKPGEIPQIDLYMDQVTTFLEERLKGATRNPEEDKVLTKTMINNYAKNKLLPSPEKKKYSRDHMILLIYIYYLKGILSISDIQTFLGPLTEWHFQTDEEGRPDMAEIYANIVKLGEKEVHAVERDIVRKFNDMDLLYEDVDEEEDQSYLRYFSYVCTLSFDVFIKKLIIEKLIDQMEQKEIERAERQKQEKQTAEKAKAEKTGKKTDSKNSKEEKAGNGKKKA